MSTSGTTQNIDATESLIDLNEGTFRHDFQWRTPVEKSVVILHGRKAVNVIGVIENCPQTRVNVENKAGTSKLITVDAYVSLMIFRPDVCAS